MLKDFLSTSIFLFNCYLSLGTLHLHRLERAGDILRLVLGSLTLGCRCDNLLAGAKYSTLCQSTSYNRLSHRSHSGVQEQCAIIGRLGEPRTESRCPRHPPALTQPVLSLRQ